MSLNFKINTADINESQISKSNIVKRKNRYFRNGICLLIIIVLCSSIISCSKEPEIAATKELGNKVYNLNSSRYAPYGNGWIFIGYRQNINYFDQGKARSTPLCNKKNCKHEPWDQSTPLEQRCNAYREFPVSAVVVHNDHLYSLSNNFPEEKVVLHQSNIDGTEIKQIAELKMFFTTGSAMFSESFLYYTAISFNPDKQIDDPDDNSNFVVSVSRVNLSTGEEETVSEVYKGKSSSIQIIGKHNSNIYYKLFTLKEGVEKLVDMESMDVRIYALDLNTGESQQVFTDFNNCFTINDIIVDDYLYLTSQDTNNIEQRDNLIYIPNTIYRIDLKNNTSQEIASFMNRDLLTNRCDNWLYFPLEDSEQIKFINLISGEEKILEKEPFDEYYLVAINDDQIILCVEKFEIDPENSTKGSGEMVDLAGSLSDFFAGDFKGEVIVE